MLGFFFFQFTELARRFNPETILRQNTLLLYNPKECREGKKIVLSSSLRIPDPSLLGDPQTSYQPAQEMTLSFPPFLLGELCCQGKGASFSFHNYFLLLRGIFPKLLRQHILILRVSDPGAPGNSWRRLWHSQEPGQPFVT